ncbi:MAG: S-layer homology domain-containing protein [Monoglobales bacterium]
MKKLICFVLLLSIVTMITPAFASDKALNNISLDYVSEKGFLIADSDYAPEKQITRGNLAGMVARLIGAAKPPINNLYDDVAESDKNSSEIAVLTMTGIMQGNDRKFRPNDFVTREELAVIAERICRVMGDSFREKKLVKAQFDDYDEISDWARSSVANALEEKLLWRESGKRFGPKSLATYSEVAEMIKIIDEKYPGKPDIESEVVDAKKADIKDFQRRFPIYQKANTVNILGVSGYAILAYYDDGPGEIFVSRTTKAPSLGHEVKGQNTFIAPTAIVQVSDPDGNIVAICDFSKLNDGTEEKIIKVPFKKAGIWTVRAMCGRTGDSFEVGMKESKYWGIRGEKTLGASKTIPLDGYIYAQEDIDFIHVGVNSDQSVSILDLDCNVLAKSEPKARTHPFIKNEINTKGLLKPDTIYQLKFQDGFYGDVEIDGIPGLICPTKEAAEFLKGGWVQQDGFWYQGPIQARARKELVRLATEKNMNVIIDRPAELPEITNPIAEAQVFGAYAPISGLGGALQRQVTDPKSFYLGRQLSVEEYENGVNEPTDYRSCNFSQITSHRGASVGYSAAVTLPLALNYAYGNKDIITRCAMAMLYEITQLSEDGYIRQGSLFDSYYPLVAGMFHLSYFMEGFLAVAPYLDTQTREIIEEASSLWIDKQGDYRGQNVTNQAMFFVADRLRQYIYTGVERHHETFKRGIKGIMDDNAGWYDNISYVSGVGHFVESGADGTYEYMNRQEFYKMYYAYKEVETADPEILNRMRDIIEESLYFESLFTTPQPEQSKIFVTPPGCFTARTLSVLGKGNQPSYETTFHEFPMAMRRQQVAKGPANSATYPQVINSVEWAMEHINEFWPAYENYFNDRSPNSWPIETYEAFNADEYPEPAILPCEEPDGTIIEKPGLIALKHKGMYFNCFYAITPSAYSKPNKLSYMGGGPTLLWQEQVGGVICSQKHNVLKADGVIKTVNDIISSCIYGEDANGNLTYFNGKETATLKWIEEGKEFVISGTDSFGKVASWKYRLTDEGIVMTASITPVGTDTYWLNLPINATDMDNGSDISLEGNKMTFSFNGAKMVFTWDEGLEAVHNTDQFKGKQGEGVILERLRIKLPASGEVSVLITTEADS